MLTRLDCLPPSFFQEACAMAPCGGLFLSLHIGKRRRLSSFRSDSKDPCSPRGTKSGREEKAQGIRSGARQAIGNRLPPPQARRCGPR